MNIVAIGGYHGLSRTLKGLDLMPRINVIRRRNHFEENKITALVQVGDFGGSTKILRELFGIFGGISGCIGDLTGCCAVLCKIPYFSEWLMHRSGPHDTNHGTLRDVFGIGVEAVSKKHGWEVGDVWTSILNRFNILPGALWPEGTFAKLLGSRIDVGSTLGPHSMKNLLFVAIMLEYQNDPAHALTIFHYLCDIFPHRVMPVSNEATQLKLQLRNGTIIENEGRIDELWEHYVDNDPEVSYNSHRKHQVIKAWLDPAVKLTQQGFHSIESAHGVFLGPGSPFGSTLQALMVDGMKDAFRELKKRNPNALVVLIMNLMTSPFEMPSSDPKDFVEKVQEATDGSVTHILWDSSNIPGWFTEIYEGEMKEKIGIKKKTNKYAEYRSVENWERPIAQWNTTTGELSHDSHRLAKVFSELCLGDRGIYSQKVGAFS